MTRHTALGLLLLCAAVSTAAAATGALAAEQAATTSYDQGGYHHECRGDGDVCAHAEQCCGGTCLRHTCWSDPHHHPPCREHSEHCLDSEDCCGALVCGDVRGHRGHGHPICHPRPAPAPGPNPPSCAAAGESCDSDSGCCNSAPFCVYAEPNVNTTKICSTSCAQKPCTIDGECTGDCGCYCANSLINAKYCADGCACFAGASKVVVREVAEPVAIRGVRTGQHVLCFEGGADMTTPGAARWCEVRSWARADEGVFDDMVRVDYYTSVSRRTGSTTLSMSHIMHLLTEPTAASKFGVAATAAELGPWVHETAANLQSGQHIAVAASADPAAGFEAAVIDSVAVVTAAGKFLPAIEHPWIQVDGVVMPLWSSLSERFGEFVETGRGAADTAGLANAFLHMLHAPLWMSHRQPVGTPGFNGTWDNGNSRAPLLRALCASFSAKGDAGVSGAANFTRALEWFAPRFAAWQAAGPGGAAAITDADVLAAWPRMFAGLGKAPSDASAGATQQCTAAGASATVSPTSTVARPAGDACSNA